MEVCNGLTKPRIRVAAGDPTGASARLVLRNSAYEGAQSSRRLRSWSATSAHVNSLLASAGPTLRNRLRQLVRSNPYMRRGRASYRSNLIGTGITPSPALGDDPKRRTRLRRAWSRWAKRADHDGRTDFYGIQRLAAGAVFTAGECFVRLVYLSSVEARRLGMEIPLRLQVLRAEMVPLDKTEQLTNGHWIRCGIEFDAAGQRVAYWVYRRDPTDATQPPGQDLFTRVPAEEMIHLFDAEEPGQIRGEPPPVAAMVKAHVLDQYDDAELDRKRTAALFAGFITEAETGDGALPNEGADADGIALAGLQPGTLQKLLPGENITFAEPAEVGGSYEAFQYRTLLAVAAGMGLPYAAVTGDVTKVNYSSQRAALVEFRREAEQLQFAVYVFLLCQPVWDAWLAQGILAGALEFTQRQMAAREPWEVEWIPRKWDWIDPLKDRQAEKLAVDNLFKPRSYVIGDEGYDPEEVDERIAADQERADRLGLRAVQQPGAQVGAAQTDAQEAGIAEAKDAA